MTMEKCDTKSYVTLDELNTDWHPGLETILGYVHVTFEIEVTASWISTLPFHPGYPSHSGLVCLVSLMLGLKGATLGKKYCFRRVSKVTMLIFQEHVAKILQVQNHSRGLAFNYASLSLSLYIYMEWNVQVLWHTGSPIAKLYTSKPSPLLRQLLTSEHQVFTNMSQKSWIYVEVAENSLAGLQNLPPEPWRELEQCCLQVL